MSSTPASAHQAPAQRGRSRRATSIVLGIAASVLLLDQLTKAWVLATLDVGDPPVKILGDLLSLRLLFNPGAALSIATGMTWLLTIVVVVVVIVIVRMLRKITSTAWAIALGLLLGGALGNLVDRLVRQPGFGRGHVVDFIDYAGFFVGNVADIAIVVAAVLIAVLAIRGIGMDGTRAGAVQTDDTSHVDEAIAAGTPEASEVGGAAGAAGRAGSTEAASPTEATSPNEGAEPNGPPSPEGPASGEAAGPDEAGPDTDAGPDEAAGPGSRQAER